MADGKPLDDLYADARNEAAAGGGVLVRRGLEDILRPGASIANRSVSTSVQGGLRSPYLAQVIAAQRRQQSLLEESALQEAEAARQETEIRKQAAAEREAGLSRLEESQLQQRSQLEQQRMAEESRLASAMDSIRDIDPDRWYSTRGTGQRLAILAASLAGGFVEGLTGGAVRNTTMQAVESAIDRDIAAQRSAIEAGRYKAESQRGIVGRLYEQLGSLPQAEQAAKTLYLANHARQLETTLLNVRDPQMKARLAAHLADTQATQAQSAMQNAQVTGTRVSTQSGQTLNPFEQIERGQQLISTARSLEPKPKQAEKIERGVATQGFNETIKSVDALSDIVNAAGGLAASSGLGKGSKWMAALKLNRLELLGPQRVNLLKNQQRAALKAIGFSDDAIPDVTINPGDSAEARLQKARVIKTRLDNEFWSGITRMQAGGVSDAVIAERKAAYAELTKTLDEIAVAK